MAVLSLLHIGILFSWLIMAESQNSTLVKPGCEEKCGDVVIPYPFGIGKSHCYMNPYFEVTCNKTSDGPKPFLKSIGLELLGVSFTGYGYVRVNNSVISSNCSNRIDSITKIDVSGSSFTYSSYHNKFTVMGCDNYAMLVHNDSIIGGCLSICSNSKANGCYGIGCCQTLIPSSIDSFEAKMSSVTRGVKSNDCRTAFMVDQEWFDSEISGDYSYTKSIEAVKQRESVPAVLEWGYNQGSCMMDNASFCSSNYQYWWAEIDQTHLCVCSESFSYEPFSDPISYIEQSNGGECLISRVQTCTLVCVNNLGKHNCSCPDGYGSYDDGTCYGSYYVRQTNTTEKPSGTRAKNVLIGVGSGFGSVLLLILVVWANEQAKRRKVMKLRQEFFKRNGGLLLQQQLSSSGTNMEQAKIFSSTELEYATDNFNVNRILGRGGQGTVYKGMLIDGRIVAIKKSKAIDWDKLNQFINEVVVLSQVNHRNVVKLLGCCLEAEVPLLVYEFISNGTLYQHIQNPNEDLPFTWEMRLRIATEIACAISYLHSAASTPIYHRDIKSSNILLDDKYRAKVSDFGISKSISMDQTHVTTRVQGTFGYLDPEYFRFSKFTEKSDVYSFGVVLIELLTSQKPICTTRSGEEKSLAHYFLDLMQEGCLPEILDEQVDKEGSKEEIEAMCSIAKRCLNLHGKNRPTMKTIAMALEGIKASKRAFSIDKHHNDQVDDKVGKTCQEPQDAEQPEVFEIL